MAPKKKKIKDMTTEEVERLTDDQVMERIFDKKTVKKLKEVIRESDEKAKKKRPNSH